MNYAIITAGGKGKRMKSAVSKQYLLLAGIPILTRTLQVFDQCNQIDKIILVIPENDFDFCQKTVISPFNFNKEIIFVSGGVERQNSVYNGLLYINNKDKSLNEKIILIHDAVRPFVTVEQICRTIDTAKKDGSCILAIPVFDTIKSVDRNDFIKTTICRDKIWLAQTPQTFQYNLILNAHRYAVSKGFIGTDDASIVEFYNGATDLNQKQNLAVKLIKGSRNNIKITTMEDFELARVIVAF